MIILSNFAERLEELMFEKNMSVSDMAKALKSDASTIYKYLNAKKLPSTHTAVKLANIFDCSVDYLLGRTEKNYKQTFHEPPPFCERLNFLLTHFKTTQYKLYTYGNFPQSAVQNWLKGTFSPTLDNAVKLAEYFDCSTDFILGREL